MTLINNDEGQWFDNVTEFLDFAESPCEMADYDRASQKEEYSSGFYGSKDFAEAMNLARYGWPEGLKKADEFATVLEKIIAEKMFEPEVQYDVTGDWIDMSRYVSGEPEVFGQFVETDLVRVAAPPKIVRIVVNVCVSAGVSTDVIIKRGAAMTALVRALERHGRRCQIEIIAPNNGSGRNLPLVIRAKEPGETLELDKVVFLMAHPSILRRLIFSSWEHHSARTRREYGFYTGRGYGRVGEAPEDQRGDIYCGGADLRRGQWDMDEATRWIIQTLKEQGIALKEEAAA